MEHTEIYRGYNIRIEMDEFHESPDGDGDTEMFFVSHGRDLAVERDGFSEDDLNGVNFYHDPDSDPDGEYTEGNPGIDQKRHLFADINTDRIYWVFPIRVDTQSGHYFTDTSYDHANAHVLVSVQEAADYETAKERKNGLIQYWDDYANHNVWGYVITKENVCEYCQHDEPEDIDSCWGFVGDMDYCLEEAKVAVDVQVSQDEEMASQQQGTTTMLNINVHEILNDAEAPLQEMVAIIGKRNFNLVKMAYSLARMEPERRAMAEAVMDILEDPVSIEILPVANRLQRAVSYVFSNAGPTHNQKAEDGNAVATRMFVKSVAEAVGIRVGGSY